jgi:SAM-dependent methyltransferase
MTSEGKVRASRYGKFRQLNRFLELVDDVVPHLPEGRPLRIVDFGSGKAYLTFALYQHLHEGRGFDLDVLGLDLKADVVERCNALAKTLGYEALRFEVGDIAGYEGIDAVDLVISLHACDTATDAALERAVRWNAEVILAVPCCQHELAGQLEADGRTPAALLEHGIVRERFAALATDALRAKLLEAVGYRTQIVEFVDLEHTAKNVLIRAVRRRAGGDPAGALQEYRELRDSLGVSPYLERALEDRLTAPSG